MERRDVLSVFGVGCVSVLSGCMDSIDINIEETDSTDDRDTNDEGDDDRSSDTGDDIDDDTEDGPDEDSTHPLGDPADSVEQYYHAIDEGRLDVVETHVHSDSSIDMIEYDESDIEELEQLSITTDRFTVLEKEERTAQVVGTVIVSAPDTDEESRTRQVIELKEEEGSWKLYDI